MNEYKKYFRELVRELRTLDDEYRTKLNHLVRPCVMVHYMLWNDKRERELYIFSEPYQVNIRNYAIKSPIIYDYVKDEENKEGDLKVKIYGETINIGWLFNRKKVLVKCKR